MKEAIVRLIQEVQDWAYSAGSRNENYPAAEFYLERFNALYACLQGEFPEEKIRRYLRDKVFGVGAVKPLWVDSLIEHIKALWLAPKKPAPEGDNLLEPCNHGHPGRPLTITREKGEIPHCKTCGRRYDERKEDRRTQGCRRGYKRRSEDIELPRDSIDRRIKDRREPPEETA